MNRKESLLRKDDEKGSSLISSILDMSFYKETFNFNRINDLYKQYRGVDSEFEINGLKFLCDEKAAIRYANKNLQTFSLELSFINRNNKLSKGWFLDEENISNSFLFVWIDKSKKDNIESTDDIQTIEVALVLKEAIHNYLNFLGWNKDKLIKKVLRIMRNSNEYMGNIKENGCKFTYSHNLVEKPVNILIPREVYKKISYFNKLYNF